MGSFCFIDRVTEVQKGRSLTALFRLKGTEEFLEDHFSGFPVMPGVLLLESLKQAAGSLLASSGGPRFYRLVRAEDLKFGQFVKPDSSLKITARLLKSEGPEHRFEGRIDLLDPQGMPKGKALTAQIVLRSVEAGA